jgi:GDP-D-mannose dehydratase
LSALEINQAADRPVDAVSLPAGSSDAIKRSTEKERNGLLGRVLIEVDPRYFRPTEVDLLVGDPSKARSKLGWQHKISFEQLVAEMVAQTLRN